MQLAEPDRRKEKIREDFHSYVRRDTPLDYYSEPLEKFFKNHVEKGTIEWDELHNLMNHDRNLLVLYVEQRELGSVDSRALSKAIKNHLAVVSTTNKELSPGKTEEVQKKTFFDRNKFAEDEKQHIKKERKKSEWFIRQVESKKFTGKPSEVNIDTIFTKLQTSRVRQRQILEKVLQEKNKKKSPKLTYDRLCEFEEVAQKAFSDARFRLYSAYKKAADIG
ncbi:MAG: hypothetical protein ACE5DI_00510 [Candidatus Micrarchaeia archaeon]